MIEEKNIKLEMVLFGSNSKIVCTFIKAEFYRLNIIQVCLSADDLNYGTKVPGDWI